jgi:spermidine synthase
LAYRNIIVDIAEIDPAVFDLARKYFGIDKLDQLEGNVYIEDARKVVRREIEQGGSKKWDYIIHDVVSFKGNLPFLTCGD